LAAILALEPAILILDEPTNGLDPSWRRHLASVLSRLPIEVILIASHNLNWIGKTTQRALVLADGEIKIDKKTKDLLADKSTLEYYNLPPDW
jgi:cobalt/nickel transport system ATP-binding protein